MPNARRRLLQALGGTALVPALPACSNAAPYDAAVASTWRHVDLAGASGPTLMRELVRCATLAANSHNTQPWRFAIEPDAVVIRPDLGRRTPAVDPDDHHLWTSLGCAAENLVQAALAFGQRGDVSVVDGAVRIALQPTPAQRTPLFDAIPKRQCTRGPYDGQPLAADELKALEAVSVSPAVSVRLYTDRARLDDVSSFVTRGVEAQMADAAFVRELKDWLRFSHDDAVKHGDGLFAASSGNPVLPHWLGSRLFDLFFTTKAETERYAKQLQGSAGVAVFIGAKADIPHWVEVGRAYQRFALQATSMGVRNAFLNQPVEVPAVRREFATWLGIGPARPDLLVRFGRGAALPPSLRRPVDAVMA
jgi:hypothetical protein